MQVDSEDFLPTRRCFNGSRQVCKYKIVSSLILKDLMQLDEANRPIALWTEFWKKLKWENS